MKSFIVLALAIAAVQAGYIAYGGHEQDGSEALQSLGHYGGGEESIGHYGGGESTGHYGGGDNGGHHYEQAIDYHAHPSYHYDYAVHDLHTHDIKTQWETRDGDKVKGEYSLVEPDGTKRIVSYTADKHTGFNAVVKRIGHDGQELH